MNHHDIDRHLAGIANINLTTLGTRLHHAYQTSRTHPSRPDGYTTTTGTHANTELTPVEAAANQRLTHHTDPYDRIVAAALHYLAHADNHLTASWNKLTQLDQLQNAKGLEPTQPGCFALARIGSWEAISHTVIIGGDPHPLGSWAYQFHRRNGRLPTIEECKRRVRGDRIYMRAE